MHVGTEALVVHAAIVAAAAVHDDPGVLLSAVAADIVSTLDRGDGAQRQRSVLRQVLAGGRECFHDLALQHLLRARVLSVDDRAGSRDGNRLLE